MFYHPASETYIREGSAFTVDGIQYPAQWLNHSTPDEKIAAGLVEVMTVGTREDDRYYYVSEELVGAELRITNTRKSDEQIRQMELAAMPALTPRQIRQALTRAGLRQQVEAAVAAGDQDMKDWWEFATAFERTNPLVVEMGTALGQSEQQLDALWALGASL